MVFRDMDDHLSDEEQEELLAVVIRRKLVVLPTDTVYGIGADPFSRKAVSRLLKPRAGSDYAPTDPWWKSDGITGPCAL